jgi:ATP-binding cassette subfamily B protein
MSKNKNNNNQQSVAGKAFDLKLLKRVLFYVMPYKKVFWFTAFLTVFLGIIAPIRPMLIKNGIDEKVANHDLNGLWFITLLMIGVLIIEAVFQYLHTYLANWLGQSVINDLRKQLFKHITTFKLSYFDRHPIGMLVTRTVSDIETIADVFSNGVLVIIGDLLKLIAVVIVMFWIDWRLALVSLIPIPILIFATSAFKKAIKVAFQQVRNKVSHLNTFVQEHITGMSIVQLFNRQKTEMERFKKINFEHYLAHVKAVWAFSVFFPVVELLSATSLALLVWWGSKGVVAQYVSLGNLVEFILFIYMLYRPIRQLADRFNVLQMGMVSSERVFKILDTEEHLENNGKIKADNIRGEIDFEHVWFAYKNNNWVLKDISFHVNSGTTMALVGATGAGKSSIINLLGRYYEIQKGKIAIDGIDVNEYDIDSLRKNIAIVLQDVFLFSDTIFNNITLNNPEITKEEVIEAAKAVGAHDFIMQLPGNYNYDVKERGAMLSVGQRQLISFIRAYVHKPKILILDEATSSIDSESEELIQYATEVLTKNRTSIVVAHRLSTIQKADKIIVLNQGEIVETGTHEELLAQNGYYKTLFDLQFQGVA